MICLICMPSSLGLCVHIRQITRVHETTIMLCAKFMYQYSSGFIATWYEAEWRQTIYVQWPFMCWHGWSEEQCYCTLCCLSNEICIDLNRVKEHAIINFSESNSCLHPVCASAPTHRCNAHMRVCVCMCVWHWLFLFAAAITTVRGAVRGAVVIDQVKNSKWSLLCIFTNIMLL